MEDLKRKYERLKIQLDISQNKEQIKVEHNLKMNLSSVGANEKQVADMERTHKTLEKKIKQISEHKHYSIAFKDVNLLNFVRK